MQSIICGQAQSTSGFTCSQVELCAIINIKSGHCGMDCAFCIQSCHTSYIGHPLLSPVELRQQIESLAQLPLKHIGLVAAGAMLGGKDFVQLCRLLEQLPGYILPRICVSLGRISRQQMTTLRDLGIRRYHHNLETSPEFYPAICTTQTWQQRASTVANAMDCGLEVCSGGVFGLGENWADRASLALELGRLGVENIPLNFLHPQPGTPLARRAPMTPDDALKTIALFRKLLPKAVLRVCGGRPVTFGQYQKFIFAAGANALMTGNYLTTTGEGLASDIELLAHCQLAIDYATD